MLNITITSILFSINMSQHMNSQKKDYYSKIIYDDRKEQLSTNIGGLLKYFSGDVIIAYSYINSLLRSTTAPARAWRK